MDWTIYIVIVLFVAFIQWEERRFRLLKFIKETSLFIIVVFLLKTAIRLLKNTFSISFSLPNLLPSKLDAWLVAIIFMGYTCYLSFKAIKQSKRKE